MDHHIDNETKSIAKARFELTKVFNKTEVDYSSRKSEVENKKKLKKLQKLQRRKAS